MFKPPRPLRMQAAFAPCPLHVFSIGTLDNARMGCRLYIVTPCSTPRSRTRRRRTDLAKAKADMAAVEKAAKNALGAPQVTELRDDDEDGAI